MRTEDVIEHVRQFKAVLLESIGSMSEQPGFDVSFHLNPFKLDDDDRTLYAQFEDYNVLLDQSLSLDKRKHLWHAYKL